MQGELRELPVEPTFQGSSMDIPQLTQLPPIMFKATGTADGQGVRVGPGIPPGK